MCLASSGTGSEAQRSREGRECTEAFDPQPPGGKALGEPQLVGGP